MILDPNGAGDNLGKTCFLQTPLARTPSRSGNGWMERELTTAATGDQSDLPISARFGRQRPSRGPS